MDPARSVRRDLAIVAAFVGLAFVPFMGKAYHIDEVWFLEVARRILSNPRHPFDFTVLWYGRPATYGQLSSNPPLFELIASVALRLTGGGEWAMRLILLPLDLATGLALYLLAARFLKRPLLATLVVIAAPAYLVNMDHLMAEKSAFLFGLWGLYAFVRGVDDGEAPWFWGSAALFGAALLSKYSAVVFLGAAAGYGAGKAPVRRLAAHAALAFSGVALYLACDDAAGHGAVGTSWKYVSEGHAALWSSWPHKWRSILAFTGGGGLATAVWPWLAARPKAWQAAAVAAACALLFSPWLDVGPSVRLVDRLTGFALSCGSVWGFLRVFRPGGPKSRGWALWASWSACGLGLTWLYGSLSARVVLLMIPPLVFASAEALESRRDEARVRRWQLASLAAACLVSLPLMIVDGRYDDVQRSFARQVLAEHPRASGRVWIATLGGLAYYLRQGGAEDLDMTRGGWGGVRRGDVVVLSRVTDALRPDRPLLADVSRLRIEEPIPLRLTSSWGGEGGFYSNIWGFLPYSLSREPLEEFTLVSPR